MWSLNEAEISIHAHLVPLNQIEYLYHLLLDISCWHPQFQHIVLCFIKGVIPNHIRMWLQLIGVNQIMTKFLTIIQCLIYKNYEQSPFIYICICWWNGDYWDIIHMFIWGIVLVHISCPLCHIHNNEFSPLTTSVSIRVHFFVAGVLGCGYNIIHLLLDWELIWTFTLCIKQSPDWFLDLRFTCSLHPPIIEDRSLPPSPASIYVSTAEIICCSIWNLPSTVLT